MRKGLIFALFLMFSVTMTSCGSLSKPLPQKLALASEVLFIASDQELKTANDKVGSTGLAISIDYYKSLAKNRAIGQIAIIQHVKLAQEQKSIRLPVYLYGNQFNKKMARELLGKEVGGCEPMVFAMIVPGTNIDGCGASDKPLTEDHFRKWIDEHWSGVQENFQTDPTIVGTPG